jgi:hypothetical protein
VAAMLGEASPTFAAVHVAPVVFVEDSIHGLRFIPTLNIR